MSSPYRQDRDRLGEDVREYAAAAALGRWRLGLRARYLGTAAAVGAIAAVAGLWLAGALQFRVWERNWVLISVVVGVAMPFAIAVTAGAGLAERRIRALTAARVTALAARYQIERARLAEIARLVARL